MIEPEFRLITEKKEVLKLWAGADSVFLDNDAQQFSMELTGEEADELITCLQKLLGHE